MSFKHVTGLLCAAAMSVALVGGARAEDKVVKIGAILPMSGGTASIGAHAKAALEVAMDIINNAHPELDKLPLAKNAGLAGLGGALAADVVGGVDPSFPVKFMVTFLIVAVIGGSNGIMGALFGALLLGVLDVAGKYYIPSIGAFIIYGVMVLTLILRPQGLFARGDAR